MARASFSVETTIDAPLGDVHAILGDLRRYGEFHPLLIRIDELPRDPASPDTQRCEMLERLRFGPFAWRSTYRASMRAVSDTELDAEAWAPGGVHLVNRFTLTPHEGGTHIVERVELEAPRLFLGYATRTAKTAHAEQFARLKEALEREAAA